jgi:PTS system mannose-specific IIA component
MTPETAGSPPAARGLILTHGSLGRELIAAAELILGHADGLTSRSNDGLSAAGQAEVVAEFLAADPGAPAVIFVDLLGGSCSQACTSLLDPGRVQLLTGVNLPMVIAFLQGRAMEPLPALVQGILARGHRGIQGLPAVSEPARG